MYSFIYTSGWVPDDNINFVNSVKNTFDILLQRIPYETCGDMMFSGHTRYTIASLSVLSSYLTRYPLKIILPIYLIALALSLYALYSFIKVNTFTFS